jgi:hypothetical protein
MRHKNQSLLMAYQVHHVNNNFKCFSCGYSVINGIVHDNVYYCDATCYQNKMLFSTLPQPKPKVRFGGVSHASAPTYPSSHGTSTASRSYTKSIDDEPYCPSYGTCASCGNTYKSCGTAVSQDGKWFCGKTCSSMFSSSQRMAQFPAPPVMFPFASNTCTMFPISVNPRSGKIVF